MTIPPGCLPPAEDVPGKKDLGRNGTYLVLRDLSQDVPAFWRFVNEHAARELREDPDRLAAATVGRVPLEIPVISKNGTAVPDGTPKRALRARRPARAAQ